NGDMDTIYRANVPPMEADESPTMIVYTRTAKSTGDIVVTLTLADGRIVSRAKIMPSPLSRSSFFYMQAGARDNVMKKALKIATGGTGNPPPREEEDLTRDDNLCFAYDKTPNELPNRWFGYGSVDVVLLHTGTKAFVDELRDDKARKWKDALAEWVRRGGRL